MSREGAEFQRPSLPDRKKKSGGFQSMGFGWQILKSILNSGYKVPTPIQRKAIPEILLGKDVVAMARTGSGKTAAFLIPMLQRLQEKENSNSKLNEKSNGPKALIMSPTRELALQTFKFTKQFAKYTNFRAAVILGGDKIEDQFEVMHQNPDIIIATPGRFLHICIEMNLKLSSIEYVVFDEADRLFEMGFKDQLNEILHKLSIENRQTLLFSATLPQSLVEFARAGLQNPVLIRLDVESKLSDKLKLGFFSCRQEEKLAILIYLLKNVIKAVKNPSAIQSSERIEQTVIFVATKHHVEFLKLLLEELGYSVSYVYSSLDQTARQINIAKFQAKKTAVMIVTDVAARGIDIPMLDNVVNFNFPAKAKLFVHRVGRVARAGQYGNSYSLVTNDELAYMHELFEFLSKQIRFADAEMSPHDWHEVYGSVPQSVIDIEKDALKNLVDSKIELQSAYQVQENAYKQYIKSRPLPDSSSIKAAKNIRLLHSVLYTHPIFKGNENSAMDREMNFLDQLKNYSSKTTIFEVNKTFSSQKSAQVMNAMRERNSRSVHKFRSKEINEENVSLFQKNMYSIHNGMFDGKEKNGEDECEESGESEKEFEDEGLVIKVTNSDEAKENGKRSKHGRTGSSKAEKRRKIEIIDKEHFIPYKPKNYRTEKNLGVNSNFNQDVSNATMDLIADDEQDARRMSQKTKWDRKKKKFVSAQSTMEKSKKIKTESGSYINASYKSNLYKKWLENNKVNDRDDEERGNKDQMKNQKFFGSRKKYFGSHKFKATGKPGVKRFKAGGGREENGRGDEKKGRRVRQFERKEETKTSANKPKRFSGVGLKNKDQIVKERRRKEKVHSFQNRKKKGGQKSGGKHSKR